MTVRQREYFLHVYKNCCLVFSDLEISFEEPSHAVMEGETLRVCAAVTNGTSAVSVTIDIDTADGTAQSKKTVFLFHCV